VDILIIKTGYSETFDKEISNSCSLGDVLRTTVILHSFKNPSYKITWLMDKRAYPLLESNPYIHRILFYPPARAGLLKEEFDIIINLEKVPEICAFADSIKAKDRLGFGYDKNKKSYKPYPGAEIAVSICENETLKRKNTKSWQQMLIELIGKKWERQTYILGYKPNSLVQYDVGLNWQVGKKWPTKAWPKRNWEKLAFLLEKEGYKVSWQQGLNNLYDYMNWINSCKLLVTSDSLCVHLGLALNKKLVVLYGPTHADETYLYGQGIKSLPEVDYKCIPCFASACFQKKSCMEFIIPEKVLDAVKNLKKADNN